MSTLFAWDILHPFMVTTMKNRIIRDQPTFHFCLLCIQCIDFIEMSGSYILTHTHTHTHCIWIYADCDAFRWQFSVEQKAKPMINAQMWQKWKKNKTVFCWIKFFLAFYNTRATFSFLVVVTLCIRYSFSRRFLEMILFLCFFFPLIIRILIFIYAQMAWEMNNMFCMFLNTLKELLCFVNYFFFFSLFDQMIISYIDLRMFFV